ncbi:MAG: GatB/YqeY domain-containing protein [Candidatus Saganbacteria bacterium]|nr:GatB/YqeY domain-containing protein [Candidatus Saganbacteria bacterium]
MKLFETINRDLITALKAKDSEKLSVLRMVKSKILYVNARGELEDNEIIKIINKYAKEIKETITETKKVGREEETKQAETELKIVEEYLPKQLSEEEVKALVKQIVEELKASSMKDMGRVMKELLAKAPSVDGKIASQLVRETLK